MASPAQPLFRSKKKLSYQEADPDSSCEDLDSADRSSCLRTPQKAVEERARHHSLRSVDNVKPVPAEMCATNNDYNPECRSSGDVGKNEPAAKLPPRYESLCDQFASLVSSIRLLRLKGYAPTFANICSSVQVLTNKGFSRRHLAQLKSFMPEAIEIGTTLLHDEKSCCMKPQILIQLRPEALKLTGDKYLALSKVMRARVMAFVESKQEDAEIPEEILPETFREVQEACHDADVPESRINVNLDHGVNPSSSRPVDGSTIENVALPPLGSFLSRFKRRFTQKTPLPECEKTQLLSLTTAQEVSLSDGPNPQATSSTEDSPSNVQMDSLEPFSSQISSFASSIESTPTKASMLGKELDSTPLGDSKAGAKIKNDLYCSRKGLEVSETPTREPDSTPKRLMSSTPSLLTPKRARVTPESGSTLYTKGQRRVTRPKALNFLSPINSVEKENGKGRLSTDEEIVRTLSPTLLKSLDEKERKKMVENEAKAHNKMINCLPKLFDMIYVVFQAARCTVITKEELIYKIMAKDLDIVDRGEIEEQLKLLQEMIPDWISEKKFGGDFVFCICKKISDPESLRARLMMAGGADA
ncbi:CDT1-like protein b [Nymphaea thermarum]|nr:CDT1-like protein b [Nymphaea thermarum]